MAIEFTLPDLGENIDSGDILSLLVSEGDEIEPDQNVIELETDKATVEVPCPHGGRVVKIHVKPGDTVEVGGLLLTLEPSGAAPAKDKGKAAKPAAGKTQPAAQAEKSAPSRSARKRVDEDEPARDEFAAEDEPSEASPAPRTADRRAAQPVADADQLEDDVDDEQTEEPKPPRRATGAPSASAGGKAATPGKAARGDDEANGRSDDDPLATAAAAGPATRRLARELGVNLARVSGSGPGGRITREDVIAAVRQVTTGPVPVAKPAGGAAAARKTAVTPATAAGVPGNDAWGPIRRDRLTKIRRTIATNMSRSSSTIPHVTNFDDADVTELEQLRKENVGDYVAANIKLTMMPFVMKAVAHALRLHPMLNATLDMEAQEIVYRDYVNLGVAVDTDRGLLVPVIRNADRQGIPQLAQSLAAMTESTRNNTITLDDLRGGTFTLSNLGAIGGTFSTPIINWPEVAVLLIGRSRKLPVVRDDQIVTRLMMPLSLSYDHRLIDGATAARFLNEVIGLLEAPGRLLLAP